MLKRKHVLFIFFFSIISTGHTMSIFDGGKACVFSPVKAKLTMNGVPLKKTTVIRRASWQHEEIDETTTDDNGFFQFDAMYHRSLVKFLPIEIVIAQSIKVKVEDKQIKIWSNSKRNSNLNGELNGIPLDLTCEITDDLKIFREFGSILRTNCSWINSKDE